MSQQEQALHAVEVFREHANRQKSWPFIDADRLADGMAQRVKDPTNMVYHVGKGTIGPLPYQGGYGTCGPTAIVRDLIQDAPLEYVELTSMLFWTGECKLWHGKHAYPKPLRASYALRHYKPTAFVDPKLWNVADWILTATLRDSLNKNFQHEKFSPRMLAGTNFPQQMQAFRKLGYQKVESESNAYRPRSAWR